MEEDNENIRIEGGGGRNLFSYLLIPFRLLRNTKLLIILLLLIGVGATILLARTKPELLGIPTNQTVVQSQEEVKDLIDEVGKIIELPSDETPTIATVSDLEKVKDQAFFSKAQVGDRVLIYTNTKKAYLYRPGDKKIIEVGVVNIPTPTGEVVGESTESSQAVSTSTPTPTIRPTVTIAPKISSPTPTAESTPILQP